MADFKIELTAPGRGRVWMDGEELKGVRAVSLSAAVDQETLVTIAFTARQVEASGPAVLAEDVSYG